MRLITRGCEFKIRRILPKWIFHLLLNALCLGAPKMNEKETGICPHLTKCRKVQCLSFSAFLFFLQPNLHWAIFNELCTISSSGVPKRKTLCLSRTYKVSLACLHFHYLSPPPSLSRILCLSLSVSLSLSLSKAITLYHIHTPNPTYTLILCHTVILAYVQQARFTYLHLPHTHPLPLSISLMPTHQCVQMLKYKIAQKFP